MVVTFQIRHRSFLSKLDYPFFAHESHHTQVRVRSLGANLGGRHFSRILRRAEFHTARNHCVPSNFFYHIFLVRSSQTCTKLDEKIPRTVHHRELRQSPETNAFPAANFSRLFDNLWPRSEHPQVHAKRKNSTLSPIF